MSSWSGDWHCHGSRTWWDLFASSSPCLAVCMQEKKKKYSFPQRPKSERLLAYMFPRVKLHFRVGQQSFRKRVTRAHRLTCKKGIHAAALWDTHTHTLNTAILTAVKTFDHIQTFEQVGYYCNMHKIRWLYSKSWLLNHKDILTIATAFLE